MPRVICSLPNASSLINGVAFISHKLGMISEDVGQDVADSFLAVDGFVAHEEAKSKAVATAATRATRAAAADTAPAAASDEEKADTGAPDPAGAA